MPEQQTGLRGALARMAQAVVGDWTAEPRGLTPQQMWGADYYPDMDWLPSGERVTQQNATALATVYACQTLISEIVGSLPVDVYRKRRDGLPEQMDKPTWLVDPVPNDPAITTAIHFEQVVLSLLADGNAFVKVGPAVVDPQVLEVADPRSVRIERRAGLRPAYHIVARDGTAAFGPDDMLHIPRTVRPGEDRGLSPIDEAAITLGTYMAATKHAGRFYRNGALMATVIKVPGEMGESDAKALRAAFDEGHTGDNVFRTAVLTGGADVGTLGVTPEQAQFLDTLKHGTVEVCRIFRVPPMLVGVNEPGAVSYASSVEAMKAFVRYTLMPFLRPIELAYSRLLPPDQYLRFDLNGLLRADPEARWAAYATALEKGVFNRDEVRAWEELPPIPGGAGQMYTVQAQMVNIDDVANPPEPPPAPEGPPVPPAEGPASGPDDDDESRHLAGKHDQKSHAAGRGKAGGVLGGSGTEDDPIRTDSVVVAQKALAEGKFVELQSERQVSTLLDRLQTDIQAMEARGEKSTYDLCRVSVKNTNLFCSQNVGVPRAQMPQLKGKPLPGSPADSLPKNAKGEVDLSRAFVDHLAAKGIGVTDGEVGAQYLKASQNQLDGAKVLGIAGAMRDGKIPPESIFVTKDDYVVDGHHRWAATVSNEYVTGQPLTMGVRVIDSDIISVLNEANAFAAAQGIPQADVRSYARFFEAPGDCESCGEDRYSPTQPRQPDGKFGGGPGGGSGYSRLASEAQAGGFSTTTHGDVPSDGYMVSPYKGAEVKYSAATFGRRDVYDYQRQHAELLSKPDHYLGGWRDGDDIYLDVSVRAPTMAAARALAEANDQLAFYDLAKGETVMTKEAA